MNKSESILFTKEIASRVAADALYAPYPKELKGKAAAEFVIGKLDKAFLLTERAGHNYIEKLIENARELDPEELISDPYIKSVHFNEQKCGRFVLKYMSYERGELLQYAMPDLSDDIVVPKLGFYSQTVWFPAIYEENMPWVSVCPSEISSMRPAIQRARGRVLTLGCGLGYYPFMASMKEDVESVTIIERQSEVIELFEKNILPLFPKPEKITIIKSDAFDYVREMDTDMFDVCFADIWEGPEDGAFAYIKLKELEKRFLKTEFMYWIEDEIRWWLLDRFE